MNRRQFFGRTIGAVAAAAFVEVIPVAAPSGVVEPVRARAAWMNYGVQDHTRAYRYVQAVRPVKTGDFCVWDGQVQGVAVADIAAGHYGWMQVYGPATVKASC